MTAYDLLVATDSEHNLVPPVQQKLFAKIGRTFPESLRASEGGALDTGAGIQAWLDDNAGKLCVLPAGRWGHSAALRVRKDTTLRFEPGAVLHSLNPSLDAHVKVYGSYVDATKREIAAPVGTGDRTITTKTAHGYAVGDVLRLVSQRRSTNRTDAGEWQLGYSTGSTSGPFFSEFVTVYDVPNSTTIVTDTALIFPGYRHNATAETDPNAGPSAYLIKTDGQGDGVTLEGTPLLTGPSEYGVRVSRAYRPKLKRVTQDKPNLGRFIQFEDCYLGDAEDCHVLNRNLPKGSENHAAQNSCHIVGSQSTGFTRTEVVRGAQAFDITYSNATSFPSVNCYVDDCRAPSALYNPITLHPGTYGCNITDNEFTECQEAGISIRANFSLVKGNRVYGSRSVNDFGTAHAGIYLHEGGGRHSLIEGNLVDGFGTALRINDGTGKEFGSGPIDVVFCGNRLRNFDFGFKRTVSAGMPVPTKSLGIILQGNYFDSARAGAVAVETVEAGRGVNGVTIDGNHFRMTGAGSVCVLLMNNSPGTVVKNNTFHDVVTILAYGGGFATTAKTTVHYGNNTVLSAVSSNIPPCTPDLLIRSTDNQMFVLDSSPWHLDDFIELGRWKTGSNSTVATSRGYPVDNTLGWLEIVVLPATSPIAVQRFHVEGSSGTTTYRRRLQGGTWGSWAVI